ncbi:S9 family peptidase [Solibacillus silvestris]|uniref:S9 family peptidase n=1 Tax=Solibacillus silvestris TaxID=76853 RepID=UPI003F7CD7A2
MTNYVTKESLFNIQSITNPVLAPNEQEAVFIRTQINKKENNYNAHLFHIDLPTGELTQWTFGNERVSNPKWSPNGKQVAFLVKRNEKQQLYILNSRGGEAQELTTLPNGVNSFLWSPCGGKVWITSTVKKGLDITEEEEKEDTKFPKAYVVDKMKYKADGVGLLPQNRYSQIAEVDLASKEVKVFTEGDYSHSLQGISHDGKTLVVAVNRAENTDDVFRTPLYLVNTETKEETVLIDTDGHYGDAAFSFDDRYIAFGGSDHTYKNATHGHVYIYDANTKTTQKLTEMLDVPVGDYAVADIQQGVSAPAVMWTENNDLYFQVSTEGDIRLYYATLEGALYPASPENEHVYGYAIFKNGNRALMTVSNATFPGELFDFDITSGERKQLTTFNEKFLKETTLSAPEAISYTAKDGITVHGWIMKPAHYVEGEKYPFIVEVHGGPHTLYANTFFHEMQLLAAKGYGVLYVNPRGSHGYSQEFVDGVRGNYGDGDYEDIMAGVDYVLQNYKWIDETRLGITGGSYGGFMTNWVVGHTNRFKAAVTQRSISNWISFYGVSDIGYYFSEWQMLADMKDVEKLWHHSPLKYAENVETPLLILHSERDFRCPIEQAEQLYITLKRMGKEVDFVRFPECDHNLSRTGIPSLRLERLEQITGWFEKYL